MSSDDPIARHEEVGDGGEATRHVLITDSEEEEEEEKEKVCLRKAKLKLPKLHL